MIQFNLLPDVKLQYVKAQRTKHLLTFLSLVVSAASIAVLALALVTVDIVQKKSLSDEDKDISKYSNQLTGTKDLDKILTVQNQLNTLTSLHAGKPVTSRLFGFMSQVTPTQAELNQLTVDFGTNTLTIGGTAPSLDVVSTYTDTLKVANYSVKETKASGHPFSSVVLSSFSRDDKGASFSITLSFNPDIFNSANTVTLSVPQGIDTNQSNVFQEDK